MTRVRLAGKMPADKIDFDAGRTQLENLVAWAAFLVWRRAGFRIPALARCDYDSGDRRSGPVRRPWPCRRNIPRSRTDLGDAMGTCSGAARRDDKHRGLRLFLLPTHL